MSEPKILDETARRTVDGLAFAVAGCMPSRGEAEDGDRASGCTGPLAQRVHVIVSDLYDVSPQEVEHIIEEALFQLVLDVRRGRKVSLDGLGSLARIRPADGGPAVVRFRADPDLLLPVPGGAA